MTYEETMAMLNQLRPPKSYDHTFSIIEPEQLKHHGQGSQLDKDINSCIDLAVKAFKKQIPLKPSKTKATQTLYGNLYTDHQCLNCGSLLVEQEDYYCAICGQKIDWSGVL